MNNEEVVKILEKIKGQKVVAITEAHVALDTAIKILRKYPDFCDVCWTSSWAPVLKDYPNAQKIKGINAYVVCQMCEAGWRVIKLEESIKNRETIEENKIVLDER